MVPRTILAAIDLGPLSAGVCSTACTLAKAFDGQVHLVHAFIESNASPWSTHRDRAFNVSYTRGNVENALCQMAAPWRQGGMRVEVLVHEGDTTTVLLEAGERLGADLIIVDNDHSGPEGMFRDSLSERLLEHGTFAVLVLQEGPLRRRHTT